MTAVPPPSAPSVLSLLDQALVTCLETLEGERLDAALAIVLRSAETPDERARLVRRIEELREYVARGERGPFA